MDPFRDDREALRMRLDEAESELEDAREELGRVRVADDAIYGAEKKIEQQTRRIRKLKKELSGAREEMKSLRTALQERNPRAGYAVTPWLMIVAVASTCIVIAIAVRGCY